MQALLDHLDAHIRIVRQAGTVHPELLGVAPVGKDVRGQDAAAVVFHRSEDGGARAVAEQHRRVAAPRRLVEPA